MFELGYGDTRWGRMLWPKNDLYVGKSLEEYGDFSVVEGWAFEQLVRPEDVVVEVGANIGAHTLQLARLAKKVIAYEPQEELYRLAKASMVLNGIEDSVELRNMAVGRAPIGAKVLMPRLDYGQVQNFGGIEVEGWETKIPDPKFGYTVPLVALDNEDLGECRLLKVDVEGWEIDVLEGGRKWIAEQKPILYVENDRPSKAKRLVALVRELGYVPYWHITPLFVEANLKNNPTNHFKDMYSFNMLCVRSEHNIIIEGVEVTASNAVMAGRPIAIELVTPKIIINE